MRGVEARPPLLLPAVGLTELVTASSSALPAAAPDLGSRRLAGRSGKELGELRLGSARRLQRVHVLPHRCAVVASPWGCCTLAGVRPTVAALSGGAGEPPLCVATRFTPPV